MWVWDITLLPGTLRYQCFYLYLVLDLFSRFIVGWLIGKKQNGDYAEQLLATSFKRFQRASRTLQPGPARPTALAGTSGQQRPQDLGTLRRMPIERHQTFAIRVQNP